MKPLSLRFMIISAALAALILLGGSLWLLSGHSPAARPAAVPKEAKSPAAVSQAKAVEPVLPESKPLPVSEALSQRVTEYHIDVRLNADAGTLEAAETVTWTHPGQKPVQELYFHLYPNAFASEKTTFMKESGGEMRGDTMPEGGFGSMAITDLRTTEGVSLMQRMQYVQPDDGNIHDRTLVKVHLPQPVNGGESVTLKIQFEVKLPKIFARMGTAGNFVMAGQWFPKLSVYEPKGTRGVKEEGWNLHQYHGTSEFYSDFGIYNVTISVPSDYIVGATGFPVKNAQMKQDRKIYQFYADDVHDFAWAASPDFVVAEEAFSAPNVPGVRIKLYLDPLHKDLQERYFQAAKAALTAFSKWYGSYPYSTLSIVVPPQEGNGAGGMEYPTLITAFGAAESSPGMSLERTVIHEIGHQYFYGMVANNEFEEAWLDESFTSYAEDRLMEQEYGVSSSAALQASLVTAPQPLNMETWKYAAAEGYTRNVYIRGKLVLKDIEQQVGTKTMDAIMLSYARKYRFKHPATADFQKVVEKVTKQSWQDYFDEYVYSGGAPDFSVDRITNGAAKAGIDGGEPRYEATVEVSNKGSSYANVPVKFTFSDGYTVQQFWNGEQKSTAFQLSYKAPLASVDIDPGHSILLEAKHLNNFMLAELAPKTLSRWTLSVTKLLETLLGTLVW
ncbi:EnpEP protein [Paenibacillus sp. FSL R7-0273]|uniref:M1 family aminopeptidase n=1 Tax=Paenibacillus sp. FSL R7-0273 TaxID=1536772 RepID=UPI0004F8C584|nr:M1 family aminopeptidase [Paenibacillus sp. FSL R7-0273]AIQ44569.1 EnpEP protein [Paenibacillus sp. FSL R7-0273]OMF85093.1 EnpEP protein [Paenibacillus sp. FSL R7-0273]